MFFLFHIALLIQNYVPPKPSLQLPPSCASFSSCTEKSFPVCLLKFTILAVSQRIRDQLHGRSVNQMLTEIGGKCQCRASWVESSEILDRVKLFKTRFVDFNWFYRKVKANFGAAISERSSWLGFCLFWLYITFIDKTADYCGFIVVLKFLAGFFNEKFRLIDWRWSVWRAGGLHN